MNKQFAKLHRAMRLVLGSVLVALSIAGIVGPWGWLGLFAIGSAVFDWCPARTLFGMKTCKTP